MTANKKLAIGAPLAVFGALGILLGIILEAGKLASPWSFLAGFVMGIITGLGVTLCIAGLLEKR